VAWAALLLNLAALLAAASTAEHTVFDLQVAAVLFVHFGIVEQTSCQWIDLAWRVWQSGAMWERGGVHTMKGSAVRTEPVSLLGLHVAHQDPLLELVVQLFP
jgi:hypothetical protein